MFAVMRSEGRTGSQSALVRNSPAATHAAAEPQGHSQQMKPRCIHVRKGNNSSFCFIFVEVFNLRPRLRVRKEKGEKMLKAETRKK
jgi:hypothetical protein